MIYLMVLAVLLSEAGSEVVMISIGESITVQSEVLGEERTLSICLPYGYEESDREYPVLIALDCSTPTSLAYVMSAMEILDGKSQAPQMIIIGIDTGPGVRDYFPIALPGRPGSGHAEDFLQFITSEVVPFIDREYRTAPYRVLYGASNAGMFVIYTMIEESDDFSAYIAASPSVGWFPDYFTQRINDFTPAGNLNLYINWASDDIERIVLSTIPIITSILSDRFSIPDSFKYEIIENGGHVPYLSLHNGLKHLFRYWQYPVSEILSSGLTGIQTHYRNLSDMYGFEVTSPAGSYMTLGQHYLRTGDIEEAINVFQMYAESYPNSERAAFFLGECFREAGCTAQAESCYIRTLELNPEFTLASEKLESITQCDD